MGNPEYHYYNEHERAHIVPYELRKKLKEIYSAEPAPVMRLIPPAQAKTVPLQAIKPKYFNYNLGPLHIWRGAAYRPNNTTKSVLNFDLKIGRLVEIKLQFVF
jgi:hypothetical protein